MSPVQIEAEIDLSGTVALRVYQSRPRDHRFTQ
jgi:hypothetical protein